MKLMSQRSSAGNKESSMSTLELPKPLLRGWSHALAAVAAVAVTVGMLIHTHDDIVRFLSMLVFGL